MSKIKTLKEYNDEFDEEFKRSINTCGILEEHASYVKFWSCKKIKEILERVKPSISDNDFKGLPDSFSREIKGYRSCIFDLNDNIKQVIGE